MIYIGVDAHQSFSTFYAADQETGEIVIDQDKVPTQAQAFAKLFGGRKLQAVATVEASNISAFVAEMLEPFVERVVIADPKVVRQLVRRSRPKTDRVDAQELAWQLSRGLIHEVYQHRPDNLAQRALARGLVSVTQSSTRLRNQIRSLLAQFGHKCCYSDLCGKAAREYLATVQLPEPAQAALEGMTAALFAVQEQRAQLQSQVRALGREHEQAQLLQSLPGVGPQTALALVTEVGDIRRFPSYRGFINFCSLAPRVEQSGSSRRTGKLIKGNRHLKAALLQAANSLGQQWRGKTPLHRYYRDSLGRLGLKKAKLNTARKLAELVHALLHSGEPYRFAS